MDHRKRPLLLILLLLLLAVACEEQSQATPTLEPPPTVTVGQTAPSPDATQTSAPPPLATETVAATSPATEPATAGAATPTLAAEPTATTAATAQPQIFVVTEPTTGAVWSTASNVTLSGSAPADAGTVSATLRAAGLDLASAETTPDAAGDWQMNLELPGNVTGTALLQFVVDGDSAAEIPVELALPGATSGPAIALSHPQPGSPVASGQVLFFTGSVQRPPDETVTIAVLYEDCQTMASTTSFNVGEGGQWWGYIVIPETVFGPACAVAYLGEFNGADWRAAHSPIDIVEADDPQARGLFIGNFAGSEVTPGESVTVYGSAYNVPDRQVRVSLQVNGATVAQGTTTADRFGYWEINLAVPANVSAAEGQFSATVSYDGEELQDTVPFEIGPG